MSSTPRHRGRDAKESHTGRGGKIRGNRTGFSIFFSSFSFLWIATKSRRLVTWIFYFFLFLFLFSSSQRMTIRAGDNLLLFFSPSYPMLAAKCSSMERFDVLVERTLNTHYHHHYPHAFHRLDGWRTGRDFYRSVVPSICLARAKTQKIINDTQGLDSRVRYYKRRLDTSQRCAVRPEQAASHPNRGL